MKATIIAAVAAALALAGCTDKNNEAPPKEAPMPSPASDDAGASAHPGPQHGNNPHAQGAGAGAARVTVEDGVADFGAFQADVPEGWDFSQPDSSMRAAEFELPPAGDGETAEMVVYYFGEGGAGGAKANIDRWVGQFDSDQAPVIEEKEMGGLPVTTVDVSGRYVAAVRPGAAEKHDEPDHRMFAAIVETTQGPFYFRLLGSSEAVAAHLDGAVALLESMQPAE